MNTILPYIKIARPDHWIKQLFILPGSAIAFFLCGGFIGFNSAGYLAFRLIAGLLATSLVASANYVINEYLDAGSDKYHPIKNTVRW